MHGSERYSPVINEQQDMDVYRNHSESSGYISNRGPTEPYQTYDSKYPSRFTETIGGNEGVFARTATAVSSHNSGSRRSTLVHTPGFRFLHDWWLELISCIFVVGSLIALFVIAYSYQDHPLPKWPHDISINSLLAIFVVILKAAILLVLAQGLSHLKWTWFTQSRPLNDLARYDNASRGPIGSLSLIWALRGRDLVSSVGALIIVAVVILDPMAQQVIRYWNCAQPQPGSYSTISRTNAYMEVGLHAAAGISTVPQSLQSAINGGVFVPGATSVSFDCSSGNCTFPVHFTMGFTSQCEDVSNELSFSNVTMHMNTTYIDSTSYNGTVLASHVEDQAYVMLNASLPSGLSTSYNISSYPLTTYMVMEANSSGSFEIILGPESNPPDQLGNLCSSTSSDSTDTSMSNWRCRGYGAARCSITPAVFKVNSSITSGKLQESISLQTSEFSWGGSSFSTVDVSCLTEDQRLSLSRLGYVLPQPHEPQWLPYNVSLYSFANGTLNYESADGNATDATKQIVPPKCIYQFYSISTMSLDQFFASYLTGSIIPYGSQWTGSSVAQQFYDTRGVNFESVDSMFRNISAAMTTHVRQNGWANNSAPAVGEVWQTETCIRVRWSLLVFPAILAGLTLVFFVAMVVETRRSQHGVHHDFKSSPLALLFHGLDDDAMKKVQKNGAAESNEVDDLKEEAKAMFVKLRPTERGWRFVAAG